MNARRIRFLAVVSMPLVVAGMTPATAAEQAPRYTYLHAGYQWVDVNYAVRQDQAEHDGVRVEGSLGLLDTGRFGVHAFGEWFDGDFGGTCWASTDDGCAPGAGSDRDSESWTLGLGASFALTEVVDLVARAAYVDAEIGSQTAAGLPKVDDEGYTVEGLVRGGISETVELEAGYRYSDFDDSDIQNADVLLGIGYHLNDWLTLRARGVVFDDDSGFELGVRAYFGGLLGRDSLF